MKISEEQMFLGLGIVWVMILLSMIIVSVLGPFTQVSFIAILGSYCCCLYSYLLWQREAGDARFMN